MDGRTGPREFEERTGLSVGADIIAVDRAGSRTAVGVENDVHHPGPRGRDQGSPEFLSAAATRVAIGRHQDSRGLAAARAIPSAALDITRVNRRRWHEDGVTTAKGRSRRRATRRWGVACHGAAFLRSDDRHGTRSVPLLGEHQDIVFLQEVGVFVLQL